MIAPFAPWCSSKTGARDKDVETPGFWNFNAKPGNSFLRGWKPTISEAVELSHNSTAWRSGTAGYGFTAGSFTVFSVLRHDVIKSKFEAS
jgi:hypothetical protein